MICSERCTTSSRFATFQLVEMTLEIRLCLVLDDDDEDEDDKWWARPIGRIWDAGARRQAGEEAGR
jgi:hypothetical protein